MTQKKRKYRTGAEIFKDPGVKQTKASGQDCGISLQKSVMA